MQTIKTKENTKLFDYNSIILHTFSRYCYQLIFSEIFNISFNAEQKYKYYFSLDEIQHLSKMKENEILFNKEINCDYNFELTPFLKKYEGTLKIKIALINKGTFEKSFYEIKIINNKKIKILPFFLNEYGFKKLIAEFINKLWTPVLIELTNTNTKAKNRTTINCITTPLSDYELKQIIKIDENEDLIFDVFHIIYSYYFQMKNNNKSLHICADNILEQRGLVQNANSKGVRSGYKNIQREKIHAALNILNSLNLATIIETIPFHYLIFPNLKLSKKFKTYPINIIKHNLKTQLWERRFSHHILENNKKKYKIRELINTTDDFISSLKPMQIRDKTENTLDNLCSQKLIKSWHYLKIKEEALTGKNWLEKWKELYIICRY